MRRNSPFGELLSLRQAMDRLFEDSYIRPGALGEAQHPLPLDVYNEDNAVVIEAALPGVRPDERGEEVGGVRLLVSRDPAGQLQPQRCSARRPGR